MSYSSRIIPAIVTGLFLAEASADVLVLPEAVDGVATFDVQNGEYVATGDVTDYRQMKMTATGVTVNLGSHTLTIPADSKANPVVFPATGLTATLQQGTWNFTGTGRCELHVQDDEANKGSETLILDGATVQGLYNVVVGNTRSNNTLILTNGANVSAQNLRITSGSGHDNTLKLFGSTLSLSANFIPEEVSITSGIGNNSASRLLAVGSTISVPDKAVIVGRGRPNDVFVLDEQSSFTSAGLTIGTLGTNTKGVTSYDGSDNTFAVTNSTLTSTGDVKVGLDGANNACLLDGATMNVSGSIQIGLDEHGHNNALQATNSTMTCSGALIVGSAGAVSNNVAVLHDVTLTADSLKVGADEGACGNRLCLGGMNGSLALSSRPLDRIYFFGNGFGNEVCLFDHFTDSFTGEVGLMAYAPSNTLRLTSGASVTHTSGTVTIGQHSPKSTGNTLCVEDGASFTAYRFALYGKGNTVIVSNATFYTSRKEVTSVTSLCIGEAVGTVHSSVTDVSDNRLILRGTSPSCGSKGETYIGSSGSVILELPAAPLETVPLAAGMVTFADGASLQVKCDDYLSFLGTNRGRVVLARASTKARLSIPQNVLNATNAGLPERCQVLVENNELILKVRGNKGFVLTIR